jgi:uncharacterized protein YecE (DUF72 family)
MEWRVGTSGFSYEEWTGAFYPADLPGAQRLEYYAERLPTVEINNTFYRMPSASVLAGWAERVPQGFRFALKAPRRITHAAKNSKDADPTSAVAQLFRVTASLGDRLGPVLFQLPPWSRKDLGRLRALLALVPAGWQAAIEFRHTSWLDDETWAVLREAGVALCTADFDGATKNVPLVATASFGYVRLRAAAYDDAQLAAWVDGIRAQPWQESFVFFKHEDAGVAPVLARRMLAIAHGLASEVASLGAKRGDTPPARKPARAPAPGPKRRRDPA